MATKKKATKKKATKKGADKASGPRVQVSASALPREPLEACVEVAAMIHKNYAGKSVAWDTIAEGLELAPKNNKTKYLIWSASAYGLIEKEEDQTYSLTETGRKIVAPTFDGEAVEGRRKAVLTPTILSKFFSEFDGHPIPDAAHFANVLETKLGVPRNRTDEAVELIEKNGRYAALLVDRGGAERPYVALQGAESATPATAPTVPGTVSAPNDNGGVTSTSTDWSKTCFYITPIGEDGTDIRKHADMMLNHLVQPVAVECGLSVVRADKITKPGLISQQIFEYLVRAKLCIADLSYGNPNAFYELGVRHMCKLPTIQLIRKGEKIPFDVAQGRTVTVDTSDVYTIMDRFDSARRELKEHVKSALTGSADAEGSDNPVHVYLPALKVTLPH